MAKKKKSGKMPAALLNHFKSKPKKRKSGRPVPPQLKAFVKKKQKNKKNVKNQTTQSLVNQNSNTFGRLT